MPRFLTAPIDRASGLAARINEALGRKRAMLVPLSWLLLAVLGIVSIVSVVLAGDSWRNRGGPRALTLDQVFVAGDSLIDRLVTVRGEVQPRLAIVSSEEAGPAFAVMTADERRFLLVKVDRKTDDAFTATLTGMLRAPSRRLAAKLDEMGGQILGVPVESRFVLLPGDRPWSVGSAVALSIVTIGLLSLFLASNLRRNTVFRADPVAIEPMEGDAGDPEARFSGVLGRSDGRARHFVELPARLAVRDGQLVIEASARAASRATGERPRGPREEWSLAIAAPGAQNVEAGRIYFGTASRPALRIRTDGPKGRSLVVSFPDETRRAVALGRWLGDSGPDPSRSDAS